MAWTGLNPSMNPYAQGGSLYGSMQSSTNPYGQSYSQTTNNPNPGKLMTGTEWWNDNPYAAGGAKFGAPTGRYLEDLNNPITKQIAHANQKQKESEWATANPATNPLSELLKQLMGGMGGTGGGGSGGSPGGSGSGMGSYTSGIDVGPVYSPQQVAGGISDLKAAGSAGVAPSAYGNMGGAAGSALQRQYTEGMRGAMGGAATDFSRAASYGNAQQQLASEKARAQSNLSSAELLARLQAQQYANQLSNSSTNNSLLGGLMDLIM